MAASLKQSKQIAGREPAVTPSGAQDATVVFGEFRLAGAALEVGDVIEMVELAPGMVPVDVILDTDDLDSGAGITLDVGILAGEVGDKTLANRTAGAQFIAASTVGQTGGIARASVTGATRQVPTYERRSIGIRVAAGPATAATTGTVRLNVLVRPAILGA